MATYGEGDPTDNAQEFYDWLQDGSTSLDGVRYAVCCISQLRWLCNCRQLFCLYKVRELMLIIKLEDASALCQFQLQWIPHSGSCTLFLHSVPWCCLFSWQEEHPTCKKVECWSSVSGILTGTVHALSTLVGIISIISCCSRTQNGSVILIPAQSVLKYWLLSEGIYVCVQVHLLLCTLLKCT